MPLPQTVLSCSYIYHAEATLSNKYNTLNTFINVKQSNL